MHVIYSTYLCELYPSSSPPDFILIYKTVYTCIFFLVKLFHVSHAGQKIILADVLKISCCIRNL